MFDAQNDYGESASGLELADVLAHQAPPPWKFGISQTALLRGEGMV